MAGGTIAIEGARELEAILKGMDAKLAKKIYRKALREGAKVIQAEARQQAPVDTGLTQKAIKVRAGKRTRKGQMLVRVMVGEGDYRGETFYASFVEYGHLTGSRRAFRYQNVGGRLKVTQNSAERTLVPPNPFMRRAFENKRETAARTVVSELRKGIEQEAAKP